MDAGMLSAEAVLERLVKAEARLSSRPRSGFGAAHFRAKKEYEEALNAAKEWAIKRETTTTTNTNVSSLPPELASLQYEAVALVCSIHSGDKNRIVDSATRVYLEARAFLGPW